MLFAAAAVTDQLDGWLARRWHVESQFGKIADPLADRLMIGVRRADVAEGRLPAVAALIVLARDVLLLAGYKVLVPRGYDFEVNTLGKIATWVLYVARARARDRGRHGLADLAVLGRRRARRCASVQYALKARREVART